MNNFDMYKRTFAELDQVASKFWPAEISELEAQLSVVPLLLETQDQFISILNIDTPNLERLFKVIEASSLSANLFLKHLVILADFGGEPLQQSSREFEMLFPNNKLNYYWRDKTYTYTFRSLPRRKFSNSNLHIDGKHLLKDHPLDDLKYDAIALLLFGSFYSGDDGAISATLAKCEIGEYLGRPNALANFIKQRYIWVSRITGGAKANNLGQLAQKFVSEYLKDNLDVPDIVIQFNGRLPNVSHTDSATMRETAFDIVVTNSQRYVAIEVSFQETTNSTIERKAGQAKSRFEQIETLGHRIAYVLDGAGNFKRETAMRTMLAHSHCSVAFSRNELDVLCQFLQEFLTETG